VFQYITLRGVYAALTTLFLCYILGGKIIEKLRAIKFGQSIRDDGPSTHLKKSGTPTMGGLLIIFSVTISMLLWQNFHDFKVTLAMISFLAFGLVGFADDYLKIKKHNSDGLSARAKLIFQFIISLGVTLAVYYVDKDSTQLYLPFLKKPVVDLGVYWIPFGVLLLMGESNAVNLTDGLDGLASGLLIFVFAALAILTYITGRTDYSEYLKIPYVEGAGELTVLCLALLGACVGFLWFNSHPAEVFMGDVGSLSLGGVAAVIALTIRKEILLLIIGGVFVLEAASVIIQVCCFKLIKRRVFKMSPLHHHFELSGWAETKVVTRFWILGGLFAMIALSTLKVQ